MTEREIAGQAGNDETERIKPAIKGIAADRRRPFSRSVAGSRPPICGLLPWSPSPRSCAECRRSRVKPAMRGNESAMRKDDINVSSYGRDGATEGCSGSNGCFSVFTLCKDSRN